MDLAALQKRLDCDFKNPATLSLALTHKSYYHENPNRVSGHNERLEFLGDTVLNLIISEALVLKHPDLTEGGLSKMRAKVVSEPTLAKISREIGLGPFLLLGVGEEKNAGRERPSLLADALEAVIAAVYLDRGMRVVKRFVLKAFADSIRVLSAGDLFDYKTALQERCQDRFKSLPTYHLIGEEGPNHQKRFEVEVRIGGESFGAGFGKSKKEAEQLSAQIALERLGT